MSLYVPIAFFLVVLIESLLVGSLALWWACRLLSIPGVNARRAFRVNLALVALGVFCQVLVNLLVGWAARHQDALLQLAVALGGLASIVMTQVAFLSKLLAAPQRKAFFAWLITSVPVVGLGLGLVLVARATLIEAFVVPTGAMAPTILGVHADRVCSCCGYEFAVNLSERLPPQGAARGFGRISVRPLVTSCPNCRQTDAIGPKAPLVGGDRIIVDKQASPRRWELVVFRYPEDRNIKFVKRLVGLPNETVEIVAGDVFVDGMRLQKPPHAAQELWLHVHDTAFRPKAPMSDAPGWRPRGEGSTWQERNGVWTGGDEEIEEQVLDYSGPITDFEAYNGQDPSSGADETERNAGDVLAACDVASLSGSGRFGMHWQFRQESVELYISAGGEVEIQVDPQEDGGEHGRDRLSGSLPAPLRAGDRIGFAVRDGQAYVVQNNRVALLLPFGPQDAKTAKQVSRDAAEPCRVALIADRCRVSLSRIVFVRDVYYTGGDAADDEFAMRGARNRPLKLGETEYFVLGDNSARSKDSRFYGDLQAADLLGAARWIYWPWKRWHAFR
jgi:signal peptidase I